MKLLFPAFPPAKAGRLSTIRRTAFVLFLLLLPAAAYADAGTPMMWATAFHLVIGNLFIGIFEGLLVAWLFHLPRLRTVLLAIAANYCSMIAGMYILGYAWTLAERVFPGDPPLYGATLRLAATGVFSWMLSIVLEWPFYAAAPRRKERGWRRGLTVSLVAQTASYALLVPYYLSMGNLGIFRETHIQHDLSFAHRPLSAVYYIDSHDDSIWRVLTDGSDRTLVRRAPAGKPYLSLSLRPGAAPGTCDLWANDSEGEPTTRIIRSIPGRGDYSNGQSLAYVGEELRPAGTSSWSVHEWFEEGRCDGIDVLNHGRFEYALAADEVFLMWKLGCETLLPGDDMVFDLWGDDSHAQVILFNLHSRRLAVLADGWTPVVVAPIQRRPAARR